ncbi:MAG: hypothetical protein ABIH71_05740 [Candidatus Omnitrophota bacterium]
MIIIIACLISFIAGMFTMALMVMAKESDKFVNNTNKYKSNG